MDSAKRFGFFHLTTSMTTSFKSKWEITSWENKKLIILERQLEKAIQGKTWMDKEGVLVNASERSKLDHIVIQDQHEAELSVSKQIMEATKQGFRQIKIKFC